MIRHIATDVTIINRKMWSHHDLGDEILDGYLGEGASEHADPGVFEINGLEKGEPEEMVPMGMGKKHVVIAPSLRQQGIAQAPDSRTGIDNDDIIVLGPDLETCRVAPIFEVFRT
jgi:hypothetical protein